MKSKFKAIDLFCGAGGASMGLYRAGYDVTGVDIVAQSNYPFKFIKEDAFKVNLEEYDIIWSSPPCQRYSRITKSRVGLSDKYLDLIDLTRQKLKKSNKPFIIENVVGAPLINPIMLCGAMFNLKMYRHRLFESNIKLVTPIHPKHTIPASGAGHWKPGTYISVAGHCAPIKLAKEAMNIDWMTCKELVQAIPPVFSEYIGKQLLKYI